ncbi:conserved oligomeric Golgi complex subunit 7 [Condylostylus longicornis]|uniref:conserved oligomeric Golgi complex subunit 7 n=1 Tax=Condylostylus longicornis TaxID=2530218 RepID=UPI00244DC409|nr:conserved oligomeric Golgi complex subunit 7 [Condylostylus longicornis]
MDYSMFEAFADDNFDMFEWVDSMYRNSDKRDDKEEFLDDLIEKLESYSEEINASLEESANQIINEMPQMIKDTNNLKIEVKNLKKQINELVANLEVPVQNNVCIEELKKLDETIQKLQATKEGLEESDGWGKLLTELEELFEKNDLFKISEKLSSLQKSLQAQEKLPGQNERESQVEGFKNRLEALASPAIVQSFSTGDIEQSRKFVDIFKKMDRMSQLLQYYRTVQKTTLQQHWNEILGLSVNSSRFMNDFYEFLAESYQKQFKWVSQVFEIDGYDQPLLILTEILPELQPTRETTVLEALKQSNDKLEVLKELSNANIHFGVLLKNHFENTYNPEFIQQETLSRAIFDYFNTFIIQYSSMEQTYLSQLLNSLNQTHQTIPAETIRSLGNANKKIFEWADDAVKRCESITQNCAICPLTNVLTSIFKNFVQKYKRAQQQLAAHRTVEQNWSLLQNCISLLQNFGEFCVALQKFESSLEDKILQTYDIHKNSPKNIFGYRLLEKRYVNELKKMNEKIKTGKENILVESDGYFILFDNVFEAIKPVSDDIHDTTLSIVFTPIEIQMRNIHPDETTGGVSTGSIDLPDYSFSPQEFITQVGQYLLTLPQHLEPLLLSPTAALKFSLEICDKRYHENIPSADILLALVVEECCVLYQNQILQMKSVNNKAAKQIAIDIEYLGNVLEELGSNTTSQLQQIALLLRASPENYLSTSSGCEPRLVTAIRQMRHIVSTE